MSLWYRSRLLLDRALAAVLLVVFGPVIGVCALAVRLQDGGPGFVAVPRVGRNGTLLAMWKLRSMSADNPDGSAVGVSLTSGDDDRITRVGRVLRAYYLDELPQLLNVVKGEMSLLGPRPEAPEYVDLDDPQWQEVLAVPPGMAGPTQLIVNDWERDIITEFPDGSGYEHKVVPVKLALDRWYLGRSSPRIDALVVVTLLRRLLPGTGSYTLRKLVRAEVPESVVVA